MLSHSCKPTLERSCLQEVVVSMNHSLLTTLTLQQTGRLCMKRLFILYSTDAIPQRIYSNRLTNLVFLVVLFREILLIFDLKYITFSPDLYDYIYAVHKRHKHNIMINVCVCHHSASYMHVHNEFYLCMRPAIHRIYVSYIYIAKINISVTCSKS